MCKNVRQICGGYQVSMQHSGKTIYLGTFPDLERAIKIRNNKLKQLGCKIPRENVKPQQQGPRLSNIMPIGNRYQALFRYQGTRYYLGTFQTAQDASQALRRKRKQVIGPSSIACPIQTQLSCLVAQLTVWIVAIVLPASRKITNELCCWEKRNAPYGHYMSWKMRRVRC